MPAPAAWPALIENAARKSRANQTRFLAVGLLELDELEAIQESFRPGTAMFDDVTAPRVSWRLK